LQGPVGGTLPSLEVEASVGGVDCASLVGMVIVIIDESMAALPASGEGTPLLVVVSASSPPQWARRPTAIMAGKKAIDRRIISPAACARSSGARFTGGRLR
jgi:hypothetical protein